MPLGVFSAGTLSYFKSAVNSSLLRAQLEFLNLYFSLSLLLYSLLGIMVLGPFWLQSHPSSQFYGPGILITITKDILLIGKWAFGNWVSTIYVITYITMYEFVNIPFHFKAINILYIFAVNKVCPFFQSIKIYFFTNNKLLSFSSSINCI